MDKEAVELRFSDDIEVVGKMWSLVLVAIEMYGSGGTEMNG